MRFKKVHFFGPKGPLFGGSAPPKIDPGYGPAPTNTSQEGAFSFPTMDIRPKKKVCLRFLVAQNPKRYAIFFFWSKKALCYVEILFLLNF